MTHLKFERRKARPQLQVGSYVMRNEERMIVVYYLECFLANYQALQVCTIHTLLRYLTSNKSAGIYDHSINLFGSLLPTLFTTLLIPD